MVWVLAVAVPRVAALRQLVGAVLTAALVAVVGPGVRVAAGTVPSLLVPAEEGTVT